MVYIYTQIHTRLYIYKIKVNCIFSKKIFWLHQSPFLVFYKRVGKQVIKIVWGEIGITKSSTSFNKSNDIVIF